VSQSISQLVIQSVYARIRL